MSNSKMQAVIVTGDRYAGEEWAEIVCHELAKRYWGTSHFLCIHGDARGIDGIAKRECGKLKAPQLAMPYMSSMGKGGGPYRNRQMLNVLMSLKNVGYDIEVLAFHPNWRDSNGTKNMAEIAQRSGVLVRHFDSPNHQQELL